MSNNGKAFKGCLTDQVLIAKDANIIELKQCVKETEQLYLAGLESSSLFEGLQEFKFVYRKRSGN